jgi:4'-phosphopantetheinyl transferase
MPDETPLSSHWPSLPTAPCLEAAVVTVVALPLVGQADDWLVLDDGERSRAGRLRFEQDRRRFVAAHAGLRRVLALQLATSAEAVVFTRDGNGKPHLRGGGCSFNLSHSADLALIALAPVRAVGIDVEHIDRRSAGDNLVARVLSPDELAIYHQLPESSRALAFLSAWTRKEAALKALGLGLPGGPERVPVEIRAELPARLLAGPTALPELADLTLASLPALDGYAACVAAAGDDWRPRCWRWTRT